MTEAENLAQKLEGMATIGDMGRKPDAKDARRQAAKELRRQAAEIEELRVDVRNVDTDRDEYEYDEFEPDFEDEDTFCDRCFGDGLDPQSDFLLPCPLCQSEQKP